MTDSVKRNGSMDFEMHTQNLNFLTGLADIAPDGSIIVPDSMHLAARLGMEGAQCTAALKLKEKEGALNLDGQEEQRLGVRYYENGNYKTSRN